MEAFSAYCDEIADQIDGFGCDEEPRAIERLELTVRDSGWQWSIRFVLPCWKFQPFETEARAA